MAHVAAHPPDVAGIARDDAIVDNLRVESRQVQVGDRLYQKKDDDNRDRAPVRLEICG
jgi:hypothetical protein